MIKQLKKTPLSLTINIRSQCRAREEFSLCITQKIYVLTNSIHLNGAALMLIPDILEKIGDKSGVDYFILPSSIHEVLIAKDDGQVTLKMLKELIHEGNRTEGIVRKEDILSDNVYRYSHKAKELKIV